MTRALRLAAAVVIAVVAILSVNRFCYRAYICNLREAEAHRSIQRLFAFSNQVSARLAARRVVETMSGCIGKSPDRSATVSQYMMRAAALRMLGRPAEAAADYRRALGFDRRPELYYNLGLTEIEAGREAEGFEALTLAVTTNFAFITDIPEAEKSRVYAAVAPLLTRTRRRSVTAAELQQLRERLERVGE